MDSLLVNYTDGFISHIGAATTEDLDDVQIAASAVTKVEDVVGYGQYTTLYNVSIDDKYTFFYLVEA